MKSSDYGGKRVSLLWEIMIEFIHKVFGQENNELLVLFIWITIQNEYRRFWESSF